MRVLTIVVAALSLGLILLSILRLEAGRAGLEARAIAVGETPATLHTRLGADGPVVVIAHGFAGSRQLMEPFALTLARNGYRTVSFDFMGHGRNPQPMTGDVTKIEGTTLALVEETRRVIDAALGETGAADVALLGHSMASDIIVRTARVDPRVTSVIAVSMFSEAVTAVEPPNLLMITGAWERFLRERAIETLRMNEPAPEEGVTYGDHTDGSARRAVASPSVEHVGVLYAAASLRAARDWLNATHDRQGVEPPVLWGAWIALGLLGLALLCWPIARVLPRLADPAPPLPARTFWLALLLPPVLTPLILAPVRIDWLPVLVADYLALHFLLYGGLTMALLWMAGRGRRIGARTGGAVLLACGVAGYGIFAIGGFLDSYVSSFWPHPGRATVILAIAIGAVPFLIGDEWLTRGATGRRWAFILSKVTFLASLAAAIALNLEDLFFLIIIAPVILLFFVLFGTLSGWITRATGHPLPAALGNGFVLAWALGVTFPIVAS
ncbi:MAG: alpha/beta fold hydrolase [Pseudomonadota bacterium]